MVVYVEYVLIDNFVIDFLLLKSVYVILKKQIKKARLILASVIGTAVALFYPVIEGVPIILIPVKIISGLLIVLVSNRFSSIKEYYVSSLLFVTFTFLVGGTLLGVYSLFNINYDSEISIGLMVLPVYAIIKFAVTVFKFLSRRKEISSFIVQTELFYNGKRINAVGLIDTGNNAYNGDSPVIFCSKKIAKNLITPKTEFIKVGVSTVSSKTDKIGFVLDGVTVLNGDKRIIYKNVTMCVGNNYLGYDLILHTQLLKGEVIDEVKTETESIA